MTLFESADEFFHHWRDKKNRYCLGKDFSDGSGSLNVNLYYYILSPVQCLFDGLSGYSLPVTIYLFPLQQLITGKHLLEFLCREKIVIHTVCLFGSLVACGDRGYIFQRIAEFLHSA